MLTNNQKINKLQTTLCNKLKEAIVEGRSLWQKARSRFFRNKAAVASLVTIFIMLLFIIFAPQCSCLLVMMIRIGI